MRILKKLHNTVLLLMTAFIVVAGCYLYFSYFVDGVYYNKPLISYEEIKTTETTYKIGETIYGDWERCIGRKDRGTSKVQWAFVDGLVFSLPPATNYSFNEEGCVATTRFLVKIPHSLPPGKYYLVGTVTYNINSARDVTYERRTNEFTIE